MCIVLLFGFSLSGLPRSAATQPSSTLPALNAVVASTDQPGAIMVSGYGFTLGGLVFIAIHDQWGMTEHETRWVTASRSAYQPAQTVDRDESFSFDSGGKIGESFEIPLAVAAFAGDSQNPALGPVTSQPTTMGGVDCSTSLMVRAYDRSTATWSNIVEVDLEC
jgi:hypothetical protein